MVNVIQIALTFAGSKFHAVQYRDHSCLHLQNDFTFAGELISFNKL